MGKYVWYEVGSGEPNTLEVDSDTVNPFWTKV